MIPKLYTASEAAEILKIHIKTLRRKMHEGEIEHTKVGGRYRFTQAQLEAYLGNEVAKEPITSFTSSATTVVDFTAVPPALAERISTYLGALHTSNKLDTGRQFSQCLYQPQNGELKVILNGDFFQINGLMAMIEQLIKNNSVNTTNTERDTHE